ncbi:hypothetical protein ACQEWB_22730 [Streptomyces sp. CA-249302]
MPPVASVTALVIACVVFSIGLKAKNGLISGAGALILVMLLAQAG